MKKMNLHYNRLKAITLTIKDIISNLEEKRASIEDNALDKNRDMTEKEKEKSYKIDNQINSLKDCVQYIEQAMLHLEDYID